ncbi:uncharacterized protein METZ01_LOCUS312535, partial [marine metagenome]
VTKSLNYSSYLQLDKLLTLQSPLSNGPEHDELLFIVIHQVYELWFKQLLHEVAGFTTALTLCDETRMRDLLKRIRTILKTLVSQVDILETMTPISFDSFRHRLESSSGFQSVQFRLLEFALGKRSQKSVEMHTPDSQAYKALQDAIAAPSIYELFLVYLKNKGYKIPDSAINIDRTQSTPSNPQIHPILVDIYHNDPDRSQVCELLVDVDEGLQEWRYRHVKMVERTIGVKTGTGGSAGAAYLQTTLFAPMFPDLWEVRNQF